MLRDECSLVINIQIYILSMTHVETFPVPSCNEFLFSRTFHKHKGREKMGNASEGLKGMSEIRQIQKAAVNGTSA